MYTFTFKGFTRFKRIYPVFILFSFLQLTFLLPSAYSKEWHCYCTQGKKNAKTRCFSKSKACQASQKKLKKIKKEDSSCTPFQAESLSKKQASQLKKASRLKKKSFVLNACLLPKGKKVKTARLKESTGFCGKRKAYCLN